MNRAIEGVVLAGVGLVLAGCADGAVKNMPVPNPTPIDENPAVLQIPEEQLLPPPVYFDIGGDRYYKEGYKVPEEFKRCFEWPVYGPLSTLFGHTDWYPYFDIDYMIKDAYGHYGIDIDQFGHYGEPVITPADGIVEKAIFSDYGFGYYLVINHGDGWKSLLAHNSDLWVEEGQAVNQGDAIAAVGSTGWSTGPHLHFELFHNNFMVDPLNYLPILESQIAEGECGP
ncbi:MAG: M23 family metallopeptidase [Patescibacteria group bacterium]